MAGEPALPAELAALKQRGYGHRARAAMLGDDARYHAWSTGPDSTTLLDINGLLDLEGGHGAYVVRLDLVHAASGERRTLPVSGSVFHLDRGNHRPGAGPEAVRLRIGRVARGGEEVGAAPRDRAHQQGRHRRRRALSQHTRGGARHA